MGAINYKTSKYITLGFRPAEYSDYINDECFIEYVKNNGVEDIEDAILDEMHLNDECGWENAELILSDYSFDYFNVTLEPGYYAGCSIDINNPCIYYNDDEERHEAEAEISRIKDVLIKLAGIGMVSCYPGWCTGYDNYKDTMTSIDNAIFEMTEEVRTLPSCEQYWNERRRA